MKRTMIKPTFPLLVGALLLWCAAPQTPAVPYATCVTNQGGTVSFRLNEAADNVKIISSNGTVTNDLGAGVKGLTVINLGLAAGDIRVMVTRSAAAGYTQSSDDAYQDNGVYVNKYEHPRGVVVDRNPASPAFGRIYIANARGNAATENPVRNVYQGIYMLNADNTVALDTGEFPRTAGLMFTPGNTASPTRLVIGKDDGQLYLCDWSDPSGGLWVTDPDVTTGMNVFDGIGDLIYGSYNHGSVPAAWIEGRAGVDLKIYTVDEDMSPGDNLWRYDIGNTALPFAGMPTQLFGPQIQGFSGVMDLVRGGSENYSYLSQRRSAGTEPNVYVLTETGTLVIHSLQATRDLTGDPASVDHLRETLALDLSPDGKTLALLRAVSPAVTLVPLTNGVFDLGNIDGFDFGYLGINSRDIAYDAVGNLYVVNTAQEWLRIFSKGGSTVVTTGTDGTLDIAVPPVLVSVTATEAEANEEGPVNGVFTVTRTGDNTAALTVNYTLGGTAVNGEDYTTLPGTVTFQPGAVATNITLAVIDDAVAEFTETAILTLASGPGYGIGSSAAATVTILDNEPTEISIVPAQTEERLLEGYSESKLGYQLVRKGLIGPALTVNLGYGGTATRGADFSGPTTVALAAQAAEATFQITSLDDELFEGSETVVISVAAGTGYAIGSPATATATIIDDDYPAGTVLFTDDFETDSSARWTVNSADGGWDSAADFAFDYSALYVPQMPGSTTTKALRFRLNEQAGAGINAISASPLNLNLSGDFRVKFKVWINYNGPMYDGGAGSTMHFTMGVGTSGDHANMALGGLSDGIWFDLDGDGGSTFAMGDCNAYINMERQEDTSGVYAAGTENYPRSTGNPYYASLWGNIPAPAAQLANYPGQTGISQPGNMGVAWHTITLTKASDQVTWHIDGILIATVPASGLPDGNVFVGFSDLFAGAAGVPEMGFVLVDNFRVETFASDPIRITRIEIKGANAEISFTGPAEKAASEFKVQSANAVNGTYATDNAANIIQVGPGSFKATTSVSGASRFYRIALGTLAET